MISNAIFLSGCVTVHDYKSKVAALGSGALNKICEYQIAECYALKYEDYIYLCNHLNECRSFFKAGLAADNVLRAALFYSTRADKLLLVHAKKNGFCDSIAVLYNAGQKVELRINSHRARDLQNAEKRRLRNLQKLNSMI